LWNVFVVFQIFVYKLDLEDFDSVRKCVKTLETADENIDILVNNAGKVSKAIGSALLLYFVHTGV